MTARLGNDAVEIERRRDCASTVTGISCRQALAFTFCGLDCSAGPVSYANEPHAFCLCAFGVGRFRRLNEPNL